MQICKICKKEKELKEYNRDSSRPNGRDHRCKSCKSKYMKSYRIKHPLYDLSTYARRRAKETGREYDIDYREITCPTHCPLLGVKLLYGQGSGLKGGQPHPQSPSLDRMDSSRGYVRGNVWVISHKANRLKKSATGQELLEVGKTRGGDLLRIAEALIKYGL